VYLVNDINLIATVVVVCFDQLPPGHASSHEHTSRLGLRHVGDRCFGAACMEQSAILLASGHQLYEQFNSFTAVVDNRLS